MGKLHGATFNEVLHRNLRIVVPRKNARDWKRANLA